MTRPIPPIHLAVAVLCAVVLAGCARTAAGPSASVAPSDLSSTASASTTAPGDAATQDPPGASLGEPPTAALAAEGGDPVTGSLGAFTWGDGGSDSPWLPGEPIAVGAGETLTATLAGGVPVAGWTATRVAAGSSDGIGAAALGEGDAPPISFPAPPPGAWSVQVVVTFGDDLGSATYYWAVSVT